MKKYYCTIIIVVSKLQALKNKVLIKKKHCPTREARIDMSSYIVTKANVDEPDVRQPVKGGPLPKAHFRWILSGPSNSGKSNLARWSLDNYYTRSKGRSFFDRIYLLSPTADIDFQWVGLPGLKDKDRITNPGPGTIRRILSDQIREITGGSKVNMGSKSAVKKLSRARTRGKFVLVIFDDAIAESKLINSADFLKLFIQGRHYNISSMVMTQSYMKVPRSVRMQATTLSMFPSKATEIDRVYKEFGPKELSKNEFRTLVQEATDPLPNDQYPFFHVDITCPLEKRYRRNFTSCFNLGSVCVDNNNSVDDDLE